MPGLYDDLPPPKKPNTAAGANPLGFSLLSDLPPPSGSLQADSGTDKKPVAFSVQTPKATNTPAAQSRPAAATKFVPAALLKKSTTSSSSAQPPVSTARTAPPNAVRKQSLSVEDGIRDTTVRVIHEDDFNREISNRSDDGMEGSDEEDVDIVADFLTMTRDIQDLYDPARPNDYDEYIEEKMQMAERRRQERQKQEIERKMMEELMKSQSSKSAQSGKAMSGDEAFRRRAMLSGKETSTLPQSDAAVDESSVAPKPSAKESIAQKMMMKMGWKEGQGLGKQEQGITNALVAKKVPGRAAMVVPENSPLPGAGSALEPAEVGVSRSGSIIRGPTSRVIVLKNMVGPGEVDSELQAETEEECTKYGAIDACHVYESREPGIAVEEAVRIFLMFANKDSAMRAIVDLDGRFFGGRKVTALFYPEWRFTSKHYDD